MDVGCWGAVILLCANCGDATPVGKEGTPVLRLKGSFAFGSPLVWVHWREPCVHTKCQSVLLPADQVLDFKFGEQSERFKFGEAAKILANSAFHNLRCGFDCYGVKFGDRGLNFDDFRVKFGGFNLKN